LCVAFRTEVYGLFKQFFEVAFFGLGQVRYFEWGVVGRECENFVFHFYFLLANNFFVRGIFGV